MYRIPIVPIFITYIFSRERCHLTSSKSRGCVAMDIHVDTNIFCAYTDDLLREDLTVNKVDDVSV